MAKHLLDSRLAEHLQFSSLGNAWHRCERFEIAGNPCPFRTAQIEEENLPDPKRKQPLLLGPPARQRKLQNITSEVELSTPTLDIRELIKLPNPGQPAIPPPGKQPKPTKIPQRVPGLERLPDGMPIIDPSNFTNQNIDPGQIGGLIQWLNNNFIKGLTTRPSFSRPPLRNPSAKNLGLRGTQRDSFLLQEFAEMAASQERTIARQLSSSFKPVGDIEREVNQNSSARQESKGEGRRGITRRQIAGAGAAAVAGLAGAAAVNQFRGGGGGGMSFPSRFPRDPALAR